MKKLKSENQILVMLAFFSISIGLWGNFRQLWLEDNAFSIMQISGILSIGTLISVIAIAIIGKYVTLDKLKKTIIIVLIIKFINMFILYVLNGTNQMKFMEVTIVIDIIMEYIIITSIYPLITTIVKNNTIYSKRKLTEYLFRDIGILFGGIFIGKSIGRIFINYNACLIVANVFLGISILAMLKIEINYEKEKQRKQNALVQYILKNKILTLYLLDMFIGTVAMSTGLGLKMLTLTNYFGFTDKVATNYLLIIGLIADGIGIVALKYLTPKNDYLTISIKFGIRFIGYVIAFVSNNIMITLIAITWSILISTAYENICDGVYINRVENRYQLSFANIRYMIRFFGEAIGVFFCGMMYEIGLKYIFGLSATFMIFQIGLAYYLIYLRRMEEKKR